MHGAFQIQYNLLYCPYGEICLETNAATTTTVHIYTCALHILIFLPLTLWKKHTFGPNPPAPSRR